MIGLVDGLFANQPAVWHKEILVALSKNVRVLGAASMGALRAAECDRFGMEGIGLIYRDYRDGRRTDDADVALLHGPAEMGFCPLTVPLVDAEASIEALSTRKLIAPLELRKLLAAAARIHFSQRSWRAIAQEAGLTDQGAAWFSRAIETFKVEQKKADAKALIAHMQRRKSGIGALGRNWVLNRTIFLAVQENSIDAFNKTYCR